MSAHTSVFEAIGTSWKIDIFDEISVARFDSLVQTIRARIELFDKSYSRFRKDSLLVPLSEKKGTYVLPSDADTLFALYKKLYMLTDGIFTPLIGQVLSDLGYDADYSLKEKDSVEKTRTWEETFEYTSPNIIMTHPAILDFGAAGKGYLIDIVSEIIEKDGIKSYCVDAGGDIRCQKEGGAPLRIGLENPLDVHTAIGVATIHTGSICGSAGNRRAWRRHHHIVDPRTHTSPMHIHAVWVFAEDAIIADGLSTCLFFVDPAILKSEFTFEYLILHEDFSVTRSKNFPAELFTV